MHKFPKTYYFINKFNREEIQNLNKNIALIYRDYHNKYNINQIKKIKYFCTKQKRKFFISNNLKIAQKLNLDGIYIPSFNKLCNFKNLNVKKNFLILGSAHNIIELKNKENQGCKAVFLAPLFKTSKSKFYLNPIKFNLIANFSKINIVALGGINSSNFSKLNLIQCSAFASITWIKKNRPKKLGRF
jgi:thiamine-phosphate pyrophosphorylase